MSYRFALSPSLLAGVALLLAGATAQAHVTLPAGGATAGSDYAAAFHVGHACENTPATTGIAVRLPAGFVLQRAEARPGWTLKAGPREVAWTAATPQAALPTQEKADFIVHGRLPGKPGTLWFKVLQSCAGGSADWAEVPAAEGTKLEFPAARLDVLAPGVAPVEVSGAWMRPAVPGQSGAGVFMRLQAPAGARLVGATTPAAENAEIHEMKMDGGVMRMRPIQGALELPPRQPVELTPGGRHLMLMDLKQPITRGSTVMLTLRFTDGQGRQGTRQVAVSVGDAPAGADPMAGHRH